MRRSTRAPSKASPNYAKTEDSEAEEVGNEEDKDEDASNPEDDDHEDGDDWEEDEEEEDVETPCGDDATTAIQMGRWGAQFLKLIAYKEEHGYCNISQHDAKNKSLDIWMNSQRHYFIQEVEKRQQDFNDRELSCWSGFVLTGGKRAQSRLLGNSLRGP